MKILFPVMKPLPHALRQGWSSPQSSRYAVPNKAYNIRSHPGLSFSNRKLGPRWEMLTSCFSRNEVLWLRNERRRSLVFLAKATWNRLYFTETGVERQKVVFIQIPQTITFLIKCLPMFLNGCLFFDGLSFRLSFPETLNDNFC